ncbi:MAG: Glucose--fructose oxidoreductase [Rhodospirillaceae bacterium]|jgi:predicted dehydrogenase|nr:MAG: Glucose--fructose oxidoreductase [Rhodospirillaceae bacterium]
MKEIGIGVIGTGFMGKAHSIAYSASASVFGTGLRPRLEMVCDLSPERAQIRAADLGFSRYSSDWREVVNDPAVELISVCTPNDTHAEISIAALAAGKHVWCEKPMSTTLTDSAAMRDMAINSSAKTIIGYNYTKNPAVTHARRLIEEGHIGRVSGFFCRYDVDNEADGSRPWSWRMSRDKSGTGANGDVLSHVISVGHYLTGSTISKVVGDIAIIHQQRADADNPDSQKTVDNDDMVSALVTFANGVKGHIGASRVTWGRKCGLRWEIHGTEGTILYDQERLNELKLFIKDTDAGDSGTGDSGAAIAGFRTILTGPQHPPYSAFLPNGGHSLGYMDVKICELHELLTAIESDKPVWPNFDDGLAIENVMDAVDRSALSGQWVEVGK